MNRDYLIYSKLQHYKSRLGAKKVIAVVKHFIHGYKLK